MCERGSLGFVSTSVIFAGFFIGSIVVSSFSDKFGRKRPLFICGFICCIVHLVSAFSPAFWVFALFRAIVGFTIGRSCNFVVALLARFFPFPRLASHHSASQRCNAPINVKPQGGGGGGRADPGDFDIFM